MAFQTCQADTINMTLALPKSKTKLFTCDFIDIMLLSKPEGVTFLFESKIQKHLEYHDIILAPYPYRTLCFMHMKIIYTIVMFASTHQCKLHVRQGDFSQQSKSS